MGMAAIRASGLLAKGIDGRRKAAEVAGAQEPRALALHGGERQRAAPFSNQLNHALAHGTSRGGKRQEEHARPRMRPQGEPG